MAEDAWLGRWHDLLRRHARGPVLELGCGEGRDTAELCALGCEVVAGDLSRDALGRCRANVPAAPLIELDLRQPLPFRDAAFPLVIASLCLHYFTWPTTARIAAEIRRVLRPGGGLLVRVNSTNDIQFGASSSATIAPNFHRVGSRSKRFFDEAAVRALFDGWKVSSLAEQTIHRYSRPKVVWEAMCIDSRSAPAPVATPR